MSVGLLLGLLWVAHIEASVLTSELVIGFPEVEVETDDPVKYCW